jgi:hypothetical protein
MGFPLDLPETCKAVSIVSPSNNKFEYFYRVYDFGLLRRPPLHVSTRVLRQAMQEFNEAIVEWIPHQTVKGARGYALLNRVVRKYFDGSEKGWYWGEITVYDSVEVLYRIQYEDGDVEEMFLEEIIVILRSETTVPKK